MPFGTLFAALVFAVLGSWAGVRISGAGDASFRVMGWSLVVLSLAIAAGLLARRTWARWLGIVGSVALVGLGLAGLAGGGGGAVELVQLFAGGLSAVLLALPATGRPQVQPSRPSTAGRLLVGTAVVGAAGFVAAAAWGVARTPQIAAAPKSAGAQPVAAARKAEWVDFSKGLAEAKASKKLMVVDFYATWCNPCKIMEKKTFRDPRVEERLRDVVPVRVDSEEEVERGGLKGIDLALRYAIESYPTVVVIDGEGHEVARSVGMLGAEEFLSWLDAVLERAGTAVARS